MIVFTNPLSEVYTQLVMVVRASVTVYILQSKTAVVGTLKSVEEKLIEMKSPKAKTFYKSMVN